MDRTLPCSCHYKLAKLQRKLRKKLRVLLNPTPSLAKKKATKLRKRAAESENESEWESKSESGDEPTVKNLRRKKAWVTKRNNTTDKEVEEVDDITPAAPVEEITDDEEANSTNENEVSK